MSSPSSVPQKRQYCEVGVVEESISGETHIQADKFSRLEREMDDMCLENSELRRGLAIMATERDEAQRNAGWYEAELGRVMQRDQQIPVLESNLAWYAAELDGARAYIAAQDNELNFLRSELAHYTPSTTASQPSTIEGSQHEDLC